MQDRAHELSSKQQNNAIRRCGDFLYFGEFPQSIKSEDVIVNETVVDERGYYIGSDGYFYAAFQTGRMEWDICFSSGEKISSKHTYYFKVEEVRFRILEEKRGEMLLLCDRVLRAYKFDSTSNSYEASALRAFMNGELLESLFSQEDRRYLLKTKVDNSPKTTGNKDNKYARGVTEDYLFPLSVSEVKNPSYGLLWRVDNHKAKKVVYTDYALATGLGVVEVDGYMKAPFWLRSPSHVRENEARFLSGYYLGDVPFLVNDDSFGVLPALRVTLPAALLQSERDEREEYVENPSVLRVEDRTFVYYGEYPQTVKAPSVIIDEKAVDARGYYRGNDGAYYAQMKAYPKQNDGRNRHRFSNGANITRGEAYYFKVEPIRWRILRAEGERVLLMCDNVIANKPIATGRYPYIESSLREFWHNDFLVRAFNEREMRGIVLHDPFAGVKKCDGKKVKPEEGVLDKVSLPTLVDVKRYFPTGKARRRRVTDYANAQEAYVDDDGYATWHLMCANTDEQFFGDLVSSDGTLGRSALRDSRGIVPCIWLDMNMVGFTGFWAK